MDLRNAGLGLPSIPDKKPPKHWNTKAADWWEARLRGERLPEHELPVDQVSADLLCPLCGEPLEVAIERTEYGAEPVGRCAQCIATVDIMP